MKNKEQAIFGRRISKKFLDISRKFLDVSTKFLDIFKKFLDILRKCPETSRNSIQSACLHPFAMRCSWNRLSPAQPDTPRGLSWLRVLCFGSQSAPNCKEQREKKRQAEMQKRTPRNQKKTILNKKIRN